MDPERAVEFILDQQATEASLPATDERLNTLIQIVDGIARRPPRPQARSLALSLR